MGQKIKSFNFQDMSAGYHTLNWNGTNFNNQPVSAGIYFYQIQTRDFMKTKRMVLLK